MITESEIFDLLKIKGINIPRENFEILLEHIILQINQHLDIPIQPQSFTQIIKDYRGDTLLTDTFPIHSINKIKIGNKTLKETVDFTVDNDDGIIYFHEEHTGFLKVEYIAGLSDEEYSKNIIPLIIDMFEYQFDNQAFGFNDVSSIKEGDITISLDTSMGKGALIQQKLNSLKNQYGAYLRMI